MNAAHGREKMKRIMGADDANASEQNALLYLIPNRLRKRQACERKEGCREPDLVDVRPDAVFSGQNPDFF